MIEFDRKQLIRHRQLMFSAMNKGNVVNLIQSNS